MKLRGDRSEPDVSTTWKQLRVVLHHALQSRRLLPRGPLRVCPLRINELRDHASGFSQSLHVGLSLEDKRVGVAWEEGEALLVDLLLSLHDDLPVVVLDALQTLVTGGLVREGTDRPDWLTGFHRNRECIHFEVQFL